MTQRRGKVIRLTPKALEDVLHGKCRVSNMPRDGKVIAVTPHMGEIGVLVCADSCKDVPAGQPWPVVNAVLQREAA